MISTRIIPVRNTSDRTRRRVPSAELSGYSAVMIIRHHFLFTFIRDVYGTLAHPSSVLVTYTWFVLRIESEDQGHTPARYQRRRRRWPAVNFPDNFFSLCFWLFTIPIHIYIDSLLVITRTGVIILLFFTTNPFDPVRVLPIMIVVPNNILWKCEFSVVS